jgi:hypothetical protein
MDWIGISIILCGVLGFAFAVMGGYAIKNNEMCGAFWSLIFGAAFLVAAFFGVAEYF